MMRRSYGFTIVELLIVIVVIAILAAISVAGYTSITSRSYDSTIMSDLANFRKQVDLVRVDLGRYPRANAEFPDFKITRSAYDEGQNNVYYVVNLAENRYALGVRSKSGKGYYATNTGIVQDAGFINANNTAQAAGHTGWGTAHWGSDGGGLQGYSIVSGVGTWNTGAWKLVSL